MPQKSKTRAQPNQEAAMAVLKQFRVVFGSVRQHFREVEETCGVTGSQLWILQEVSRAKGVGVSELALKLSIHQSTCSQLVEKLTRAGLVVKTRSPEDQRRVGLDLSPEAKRLLKTAPGPAAGVLPEALQSLPGEELRCLQGSLAKLIEHLGHKDEGHAERPLADL